MSQKNLLENLFKTNIFTGRGVGGKCAFQDGWGRDGHKAKAYFEKGPQVTLIMSLNPLSNNELKWDRSSLGMRL